MRSHFQAYAWNLRCQRNAFIAFSPILSFIFGCNDFLNIVYNPEISATFFGYDTNELFRRKMEYRFLEPIFSINPFMNPARYARDPPLHD